MRQTSGGGMKILRKQNWETLTNQEKQMGNMKNMRKMRK